MTCGHICGQRGQRRIERTRLSGSRQNAVVTCTLHMHVERIDTHPWHCAITMRSRDKNN